MSQGSESVVLTGCGWVTPFATGSITEVLSRAWQSGGVVPGPQGERGVRPPVASEAASEERRGAGYWAGPDERVEDFPELSREL